MAISFVGSQVSSQAGRTTAWPSLTFALTGGSDSTPQAGDLVLVYYAIAQDGTGSPVPAITTPTDYTSGTQLDSYNGVNFAIHTNYFYKFMGGTPDTAITLGQTQSARNAGGVLIMVFRGVDATTPLDGVTPTTFTGIGLGSDDRPDPAPITPNSAGAWVVALGAQAVGTAVLFTAPTTGLDSGAFWSRIQVDSADVAVGGGYYSGWTSGSHDIDKFNGGVINANNKQAAYTLVLKPSGGSTAGYMKVWNGSSWVEKPVKVWNGSSWVIKPVKFWNGSSWVSS